MIAIEKEELVKWIKYLMSTNKMPKFYQGKEWKKLKKEVLRADHYECQLCKSKRKLTILNDSSPVHHIKEVKKEPALALSKYYIDRNGKKKRQLISLCEECHNEIHKRFQKKEPLNIERW